MDMNVEQGKDYQDAINTGLKKGENKKIYTTLMSAQAKILDLLKEGQKYGNFSEKQILLNRAGGSAYVNTLGFLNALETIQNQLGKITIDDEDKSILAFFIYILHEENKAEKLPKLLKEMGIDDPKIVRQLEETCIDSPIITIPTHQNKKW